MINGFSMTSNGMPAITHAFNNERSILSVTNGGSGLFEPKCSVICGCFNY